MRSAALALIVAALTLLPAIVLVQTPTAEAATTRVLAITAATAQPTVPFKEFDGNPPKVFDLNGDGQLEIIAQNDNQWVYVFDSKDGKLLAEVTTTFPSSWGARSFNGPEAAVLDSGGVARLIVMNSAAVVTSYRLDLPASTRTQLHLVKEWERRMSDCFSNPGSDSKPVFADLDKDGVLEIILSTEESGVYALRANGNMYWKNCLGGGNAEPTIADLNLDGYPDVVFGSDGGVVAALHGRTGAWMWGYNVLANFNLRSGSMPVGVAVGQLDGLGGPDIAVGVRDSHNATDFSQNHAMLLALSSTGKLLWARQDAQAAPLTYTHAMIVDTDGNGQNEVYWADWNTMGHKPPYNEAEAWKVTGPAHFYRYTNNGTLVWRTTLPTWWNNKDAPLADVDGDGVQEMLANGPNLNGHDGIWYLDTRTGAQESFVDVYPWKVSRAPVVADLWGTGTMQWVVQVGQAATGAGGPGILVYNTGSPYSSAWPHLPYPQAGTAPAPPPPPPVLPPPPPVAPPPPPPSSTTFEATFTVKAANEWWQELYVNAPGHTITAAELRVNGGAWIAMSKSSWGAWTKSTHSPAGSRVEFLVTDSAGAKSQSLPFTWMDGTSSRGSTTPGSSPPPPPPPPAGSYQASFTVSPNVNNWWVEVTVQASGGTTAKVDAQVNGGAWVALEPKSWGAWAKSFHVPSGSQVVFRATSSLSETATSPTTTWR